MSSVPETVQWKPTDTSEAASADPYEDVEQGDGWSAGKGEIPAWVASLLAHGVVIACLAMITFVTPPSFVPQITSEVPEEQVDYKLDSTIVDQIGNDSDRNKLSPSQEAAQARGEREEKQVDPIKQSEFAKQAVVFREPVVQPKLSELTEVVAMDGTTERPGGVEGAVDRLTLEIASTLRRDKTVVVWLFDRSISVNQRRDAIANRFENVYRQLGLLVPDEARSLKTAVASFGQDWQMVTDGAVDDVSAAIDAIRRIEPDTSGEENVFTAVREVAGQLDVYRRSGARKREIMLIVVTDEAGSDQLELERTIEALRRKKIRAYVVGNAAPFGRKEVEIPWESAGEKFIAVLEPGPETFLPELVQLPFWSGPGDRDLKQMSSGFGPYALTRLCVETGGMYLITDDTSGPTFDHVVMRNYAPDYSTPRNYVEHLAENAAKVSLVRTIARFDPSIKSDPVSKTLVDAVLKESKLAFAYARLDTMNVPTPQRVFEAQNDTILRQQITEAQEPMAVLKNQLQQIDAELMQGAKARDQIEELRWRANYDLAVGRLLALRARTEGYDKALAAMKSAPKTFEKPDSNRWRLVPTREITTGPQIKKLAKQADEALARIVDEHPGTPWAVLASRELAQPLGWDWQEFSEVVVDTGNRANMANDDPRLLLAEEEARRRAAAMKKDRPAPPKKIKI